MTDLQKEQANINKLTCPVYNANELHTVEGCTWGGSKKFNIDPQIVSVHCEGLMHSWDNDNGGTHACTCQLANDTDKAFDQYEADNKLISVGG